MGVLAPTNEFATMMNEFYILQNYINMLLYRKVHIIVIVGVMDKINGFLEDLLSNGQN